MIRIIIADDHQLVRRGLKQVLEQQPDMKIVGEGANGEEVIKLLESGLEADVLLADLNMSLMDGIELANAITD